MTLIFILVALCMGITAGGYVVRRRSIAYKKRWQEALNLVKQLNDGEKPALSAPKGDKWKLDITYATNGPYAYFYAVKGNQRQRMGQQYDPYLNDDLFESQVKRSKNMIRKMNEAEC